MKIWLLTLLIIILPLLGGCLLKQPEVVVNNESIKVEVARTTQEKYQGLSQRAELCDRCGMIFVFDQPTKPSFVMRDMEFALDIIWISQNKIIQIDKDLPPAGPKPRIIYKPAKTIDQVLEIKAGLSDQLDIKVGDDIILNYD